MNHKRKGPNSTRAGCLLCKPHKHQAVNDLTVQEKRHLISAREQLAEEAMNVH